MCVVYLCLLHCFSVFHGPCRASETATSHYRQSMFWHCQITGLLLFVCLYFVVVFLLLLLLCVWELGWGIRLTGSVGLGLPVLWQVCPFCLTIRLTMLDTSKYVATPWHLILFKLVMWHKVYFYPWFPSPALFPPELPLSAFLIHLFSSFVYLSRFSVSVSLLIAFISLSPSSECDDASPTIRCLMF